MSTTDAPARPDLSHLDPDVRLRIEVAETKGAFWKTNGRGDWFLREETSAGDLSTLLDLWVIDGELKYTHAAFLPNPLTDPAAWGTLMEKERIALIPSEDGWYALAISDIVHQGAVHEGGALAVKGMCGLAAEPGVAVSLATLAKHGRDTSPYTEGA